MRPVERSISIAGRPAATMGASIIAVLVMATMCCCVACFSDANSGNSEDTPTTNALSSTSPADYSPEVVRFTFQGKRKWQRVVIDDLDALLGPAGERLLPIRRLLKSIDVKLVETDGILAFQVDGASPVSVDLANQRVTIGDSTATVVIVATQSAITQQDDIYLPTSSIAFMLSGDLAWDEQQYAFTCGLNRILPIWRDIGASMFSGKTQMLAPDLPELLPAAQPRTNGLDFMRLRLRSSASIIDPSALSGGLSADDVNLDTWGNIGSGQLRVNLGVRPSGSNNAGYGAKQDPVRLDTIEWTKRIGSAVVAAGDSRFGLNDLILPYMNLTGLRIQGGTGGKPSANQNDDSERSYLRPRSFEGYAPVGSTVEIYVNDRLFDTQQVVAMSAAAPPGSGGWSFENVGIPSGRMSEVRIVVTDPSGNKTVSRQSVLTSLMLEPKGHLSYTAGIGTNRNRLALSDTSGLLAAARATMGLSDRLTVGLTTSFSGGFYDRLVSTGVVGQSRIYPRSSSSIGGEFAWSPTDTMLFSGTTAFNINVQKENSSGAGAWAALLNCDLFAGKSTFVNGRLFHYGPSFFNGTNPALADRSGVALSSQHQMGRLLITAAIGTVVGRGSASEANKSKISFQNMEIGTRLGKTATLKAQLDRVSPGAGLPANVMTSVAFSSEIARVARLEIIAAAGSALATGFDGSVMEGLSLPVNLYESSRKAIGLSTPLGSGQSLSIQYRENVAYRRLTLVHDLRPKGGRSLLSRLALHTELGRDLVTKLPYADGFLEYRPSALSQSSLSVRGRYQNDEWKVMLNANTTEIFGFFQQQARRVTDRGIDPQNGAVSGVVFLDYNGNGLQESGEPGVSDIKVLNDNRRSSIAGKSGLFIMPSRSRTKKERVYLDVASVPANYSLSNGQQTAYVTSGSLTEVSLGITPLHSITGKVVLTSKTGGQTALPGVRVYATKAGNGVKLPDSVTAVDGTFYLGEVKPGEYDIHIDAKTIPEGCTLPDGPSHIVVPPAKDSQELPVSDIVVSATP